MYTFFIITVNSDWLSEASNEHSISVDVRIIVTTPYFFVYGNATQCSKDNKSAMSAVLCVRVPLLQV